MKKILLLAIFIPCISYAWSDEWTARDSSRNWTGASCTQDGSLCVATAYGSNIYTSTDSGATWISRDSVRNWTGASCTQDGSLCVATAYGSNIYTSTDSGATWISRDSIRNWNQVSCSADASLCSAVVFGGNIYTSTDLGVTWTARDSSRNWRSIECTADGYLCVAGGTAIGLYRSTDLGVTWSVVSGFSGTNYNIGCSDDGMLCIAGNESDGELYYSFDLASNWTSGIYLEDFTRASWVSSLGSHAIVGGAGGNLYVSSDGAITWSTAGPTRNWRFATCSLDMVVCIATVYGGNLYTSYNPITPSPTMEFITEDLVFGGATIDMWITLFSGIIATIYIISVKVGGR